MANVQTKGLVLSLEIVSGNFTEQDEHYGGDRVDDDRDGGTPFLRLQGHDSRDERNETFDGGPKHGRHEQCGLADGLRVQGGVLLGEMPTPDDTVDVLVGEVRAHQLAGQLLQDIARSERASDDKTLFDRTAGTGLGVIEHQRPPNTQ